MKRNDASNDTVPSLPKPSLSRELSEQGVELLNNAFEEAAAEAAAPLNSLMLVPYKEAANEYLPSLPRPSLSRELSEHGVELLNSAFEEVLSLTREREDNNETSKYGKEFDVDVSRHEASGYKRAVESLPPHALDTITEMKKLIMLYNSLMFDNGVKMPEEVFIQMNEISGHFKELKQGIELQKTLYNETASRPNRSLQK